MDKGLPENFQKYIIYSENLCQELYNIRVNIPFYKQNLTECAKLARGIITKGFEEALETYNIFVRNLDSQNTSVYLD